LKRILWSGAAWLALSACAKPSHETTGNSGISGTTEATARTATSAPGPAAPSSSAPALIPTPEDAEEDAAHRITEQNLESELDRLEREIQAE
jgi:hypothetical protein